MALANPDNNAYFTTTGDSTATTLETIGDSVKTRGREKGTVKIGLSGGSVIAIDQFELQGRVVEGSGTWMTFASTWGTANENRVKLNSPTDLAATPHGSANARAALVDFSGWAEVRAQAAQAAVTASAVTRTLEILFAEEANKGGR